MSMSLDQLVQQFPSVFDGQLGQLPGELHPDVDPSIKPGAAACATHTIGCEGRAATVGIPTNKRKG